jgi:hypothetical protein
MTTAINEDMALSSENICHLFTITERAEKVMCNGDKNSRAAYGETTR